MARAGVSLSTAMCEHVALSRAELFAAVQVSELRTFSEIIARFGTGRGCDICKPVIASVLASLYDEHVLAGDRAALQDTNDRVMANLQKDGTYSVVPRVPGGEILPEQLVLIGQVAQDYGLYTKITGGQRIDLFGARLEQLPAIWARLVDGRDGVGARLRQGAAHGEVVRRVVVVPLRGAGLGRHGGAARAALPRPAQPAQAQAGGLRVRPRVRRGARQGRRPDRHRQGLEHLRRRQRRLHTRGTPSCSSRTSTTRPPSRSSTATSSTTCARPTACSAPRPGSRSTRAASTGSARSSSTTPSASPPTSRRYMARHVDDYEDEWAAVLRDPERLRQFSSFVNAPDVADPTLAYVTRARPAPARDATPSAPPAARHPDPSSSPRPPWRFAHDRRRRPRSPASTSARSTSSLPSSASPRSSGSEQVAVFRLADDRVFAVSNLCPFSGAAVISRGITGSRGDVPTIASPGLQAGLLAASTGGAWMPWTRFRCPGVDPTWRCTP